MNIAVIIAAGVGHRTGQHVPKQFINVLDKPIIAYTLEKFQNAKNIDAIEVVCLKGWEEILTAYAQQYGIAKLKWVVDGGNSSQESIYAGLNNLEDKCSDNDIVVIHDGIRPMVEEKIIDSCIEVCLEHGNGITALPVYEQVFKAYDEQATKEYIPRDSLRILQTPQAYVYKEIKAAYDEAFTTGVGTQPSAYANTMMTELGRTLYFSDGSTKNIKITTKDDIEIFKAMLGAENDRVR
jgi:2-C-methyl-D-erythritol 4-phosphate cytidylyltransferase